MIQATYPTRPNDDDMRRLFAPLAADEPTLAERSALRRHTSATPRRSLSRRTFAGVFAATGAVALGFALLPGASPSPGPETAAGALRAAAAIAADRPVPGAAEAPYRYTRTRDSFTYEVRSGDRQARHTIERVGERWVGAKWRGQEVLARGESTTSGDPALARSAFGGSKDAFAPREGRFAYGDGPLAELDPTTLPPGRDAIAATLREGIRLDRWSPYPESRGKDNGRPGVSRESETAYSFILLLVHARLTPEQRAALLDVLAGEPAARSLGAVKDSEGREGRGIALEYGDAPTSYGARELSLVFDPRTSEILEWALDPGRRPSTGSATLPDGRLPAGSPARVETVLETGYAREMGERP